MKMKITKTNPLPAIQSDQLSRQENILESWSELFQSQRYVQRTMMMIFKWAGPVRKVMEV